MPIKIDYKSWCQNKTWPTISSTKPGAGSKLEQSCKKSFEQAVTKYDKRRWGKHLATTIFWNM